VGLDSPGDIGYLTQDQVTWLDSDLTAAEGRGIVNAFIYDHGSIYCMDTGLHCACSARLCNKYDYYGLVTVLNKHPIFAAQFAGHEHVTGIALIDSTRIASVTAHPWYQILDSPAGGDISRSINSARCDFCAIQRGFTYVTVTGNQITVQFYKDGTTVVGTTTFTNV
jgi:hypothetical protein